MTKGTDLKHFINKRTSLCRFIFLWFLESLWFLIKLICYFLLPFLLSIILFFVFKILNIDYQNFDPNLGWGLFGAAASLFSIFIAIFLGYTGLKHYFKTDYKRLFLFMNAGGIFSYLSLVITNCVYLTISLVCILLTNPLSISASFFCLIYSSILILMFVIFSIKTDEKRYLSYLKNTGVFKNKDKLSQMEQHVMFWSKHPKLKNYVIIKSGIEKGPLLHEISNIEKYYKEMPVKEFEDIGSNTSLLCTYLDNVVGYVLTTMDLIILESTISEIREKVVSCYIEANKIHQLSAICESLMHIMNNLFQNKIILNEIGLGKKYNLASLEKENTSNTDCSLILSSMKFHIDLCYKIIDNIYLIFTDSQKTLKGNPQLYTKISQMIKIKQKNHTTKNHILQ